jgi:hypothetical protein
MQPTTCLCDTRLAGRRLFGGALLALGVELALELAQPLAA